MKTLAALLLVMVMVGCATPPPPDLVRESYEVEKPIATGCKFEWPDKPNYKTQNLDMNAADDVWLKAALYERELMLSYIPKLEARLKGCQ